MNATGRRPFRDRISYQALLLGGFSLIATALLVLGDIATSDVIALRVQEDLRASLGQVIPSHLHDNDLLQSPLRYDDGSGLVVTVYRGTEHMQVRALAWELVGNGYAGDIRIILGIAADGTILGVRVLAHTETPGLGDKIEAARSDWILGFTGLSLGQPAASEWKVRKDGGRFDAFSGATITPRAVVEAIHEGLVFFRENRTALIETQIAKAPVLGPIDDGTDR
jgi:Na+-translocating ferredoxin:NAD+ oxidoreductase subunit G